MDSDTDSDTHTAPDTGAHEPRFRDDVRTAVRLCVQRPAAPLVYLAVAVGPAIGLLTVPLSPERVCPEDVLCPQESNLGYGLALLLALLLAPLYVGLAGAIRLWFARQATGADLPVRDLLTCSLRFLSRFFVLGLIVLAHVTPFVLVVAAVALKSPLLGAVLTLLLWVALDVALTFVTPGLALYQPSPWRAFRSGIRLLRTAPHCAPYAFVPPMAVTLSAWSGGDAWRPLAYAGATLGPVATLVFAGATVLYLVRHYEPMSDEGSLGVPRHRGYVAP